MNDRLSEAIELYFSHGLPGEYGDELLAAHYREAELPELQRDIGELIDRSLAIGSEFRHAEISAAMEAVMEDLRREHPELSEEAIQALGRNWSFCNR
jgi:hypothetical protein